MAKNELDNIAVSTFCESMAMMMSSGIQTDEAVALLLEDSDGGKLGTAIAVLREKTERGDSFARAVKECGMFPGYAEKMIAMGESTGRLENTMTGLAGYYTQQQIFAQRIKSALRYPAIIMAVISAILVVMTLWVLPVFQGVYDRLTGSLGSSSYSYIGWSAGLCLAALIIMLALLALLAVCSALRRSDRGKEKVNRILSLIPGFDRAVRNTQLCRFFSAFILLVTSGENEDTAAAEAESMVTHKKVRDKLDLCRGKMAEGLSFAQAAYETRLLKPVYGRMLLAGDRSGSADSAVKQITRLLEQDCVDELEGIVSVSEPVLSGTLLFVVAFSLISVMLPLIGIMNTIG